MIAIVDFGSGNLRSVQKAFEKVGSQAVITQDPVAIKQAAKVVLPGVGSMKPAMEKLRSLGLIESIHQVINDGKPFLGICLGLQLLFDSSDEGGQTQGLGILAGCVTRFKALKVPHMGWNQIHIAKPPCKIYQDITDGSYVYFCHSYFVNPKDKNIITTKTDYGLDFTSSVNKENIFGVQFHPEKSQTVGLKIISNFAQLK
ncbi:MAG: imidazole glycerol phosphate synthase subunit HisH [Candidatus Omnitrophota bacterium]